MSRIVTILPCVENCGDNSSGAIALSTKVFTLYSRFKEKITVFGSDRNGGYKGVGYQYIKLKQKLFFKQLDSNLGYSYGCLKQIKKLKPHLIEVRNNAELALFLAKKTNIPVLMCFHNDPKDVDGSRNIAGRKELVKKMAGITCVSEYVKSKFLENLDRDVPNIYVAKEATEKQIEKLPKEKIILFAGRIVADKGITELALALKDFLPKNPKWCAVIIGSKWHRHSDNLSAYEKEVFDILEKIPNVKIKGFLPPKDVMEFFARSEIVVVPSKWQEPYGRTALEGILNGCAVISSGTGGLKEITADAAYYLPEVSPDEISKAFETLINDDSLRDKLQRKGLKRAEKLSADKCTAVLDDIREKLI